MPQNAHTSVGTIFYYEEPSTGAIQVETATAAGTVTAPGNAAVILTAAGLPGSPKTLNVPVALNDSASLVAGKIRDALNADPDIVNMFVINGSNAAIILTKKLAEVDDTTLNLSIATGTATGITTAATSANTTTGVAPTAKQIYGLIAKPAMPGLPNKVDATSQEDRYQKSASGARQMPDANYQFKHEIFDATTSNYEKFIALEIADSALVFGVKYPDGKAIKFKAKPFVQRDGTGVGALETFTVGMFNISCLNANATAPANIILVSGIE